MQASAIGTVGTAVANAQNLNLNRDYVKADAPEMQAMLTLVNAWDPLVYVDLPAVQLELLDAVLEVNPNTVVVLNTGDPVLMPWATSVAGILHFSGRHVRAVPGELRANVAGNVDAHDHHVEFVVDDVVGRHCTTPRSRSSSCHPTFRRKS